MKSGWLWFCSGEGSHLSPLSSHPHPPFECHRAHLEQVDSVTFLGKKLWIFSLLFWQLRMLGHEQWVGLTSSPPFPPPTKGGCTDCDLSIIWETLYKPNPMVVVSGVAFSPRRGMWALGEVVFASIPGFTEQNVVIWPGNAHCSSVPSWRNGWLVLWSELYKVCGGRFSLIFLCGSLVVGKSFFGDVVCRSPSFESGETDLDVNPSCLAVIVRKLLNLLNLSFSSVKWGSCLLQGYVKD